LPGPLQRRRAARNQNAAPVKLSDLFGPADQHIRFSLLRENSRPTTGGFELDAERSRKFLISHHP